MLLKTSNICFILLATVVSHSYVCGAVVDANAHPRSLGRRAILDEGEQLLWMDLNYTLGSSYNSVVAQTGVGGDYAGWRPATNEQVTRLFEHVGIRLNGPGVPFGPEPPGAYLMSIWGGSTHGGSFNGSANGLYANFSTSDITIRNNERDFSFYFVAPGGSIGEVAVSTVLPDTGYTHIAVALVRDAVPEPSGILLAVLGALSLSVSRGFRRSAHQGPLHGD